MWLHFGSASLCFSVVQLFRGYISLPCTKFVPSVAAVIGLNVASSVVIAETTTQEESDNGSSELVDGWSTGRRH